MFIDRKCFKKAGYPEELIDKIETIYNPNNNLVVTLFATGKNHLPMLSYYANISEGLCIEYDVLDKSSVHQDLYEEKRVAIANLYVDFAKEVQRIIASDDMDLSLWLYI